MNETFLYPVFRMFYLEIMDSERNVSDMLGGENYEEESALFDGKDSEYGGRSFCGFTMRRQIVRVKSARNVT